MSPFLHSSGPLLPGNGTTHNDLDLFTLVNLRQSPTAVFTGQPSVDNTVTEVMLGCDKLTIKTNRHTFLCRHPHSLVGDSAVWQLLRNTGDLPHMACLPSLALAPTLFLSHHPALITHTLSSLQMWMSVT